MNLKDIIEFWFTVTTPAQWFKKDPAFDTLIRERFLQAYWQVVKGEMAHWRESPEGRLAEIIVLDQFARNIFRGTQQSFMYDPLALALAQEAVRAGDDAKLPARQRSFLYMPYMHSESAAIHVDALRLFQSLGGDSADYEIKHKAIIDRFGRYPHRNEILSRVSTPEEMDFIKTNPGF